MFSKREKIMAIVVVSSLLLAGWAFLNKEKDEDAAIFFQEEMLQNENGEKNNEEPVEEAAVQEIMIDVKGAVKNPGVYTMEQGDRVIDAIEKSGGLLKNADEKQINLAGMIKDEMVIYVPKHGEEAETPIVTQNNPNVAEGGDKVKINSASSEELQKLPGIGPAKAEAIISYREENGAFKSVDDLLNVSGIGVKSLEKLKDIITID
ncbi:competence protein ComE [Pueribacillus theae]|uniref:Competence protein ComE n=1 Tax=Pueribacillus theae TaxID=2171751 RepID=A0A2U1K4Q1_9BACI|nr:helix-hairpin-helix domain-containing protein [Pueribacillus theae]PWA12500.1 competence protein ComE [Pueribacillus theae]